MTSKMLQVVLAGNCFAFEIFHQRLNIVVHQSKLLRFTIHLNLLQNLGVNNVPYQSKKYFVLVIVVIFLRFLRLCQLFHSFGM